MASIMRWERRIAPDDWTLHSQGTIGYALLYGRIA